MVGTCSNPDCTVAATNKCVLLHANLLDCKNYEITTDEERAQSAADVDQTSLDDEEVGRSFHAGLELGLDDTVDLMQGRYGTVVAILGLYDVGKTCLLASLYLLASCGALLPDLAFAGSRTLSGFEARARRLRRWPKGLLPKQLVDHTVLADPRSPALMHLALQEGGESRQRHDLLLTDLPGEWTKALVEDATTSERFAFLHRADGIVIALDGPTFLSSERHAQAHEAKLLLTRLAATLNVDRSIPIVLAVCKADELSMNVPLHVEQVRAHAEKLGFSPLIVPVAAISRTPAVAQSGTGIREILDYFLKRDSEIPAQSVEPPKEARHFLRMGNG